MCIRNTKARSSLRSGKMVKTTKGICGSYIKNEKKEKVNLLGSTVQFNRWPRGTTETEVQLKIMSYFLK